MWEKFKNCFIKENPVFGLFLGLCSCLAISTSLNNAIGMGLSVTLVLVVMNSLISVVRNYIPSEIRIPIFIVIIATLVSILQMVMHAFMPELFNSLGAFLGLITVNCIILGRAESFASKNPLLPSFIDGLGSGLGYTFALVLVSGTRQFLSTMGLSFYNPLNAAQMIFDFKLPFEAGKITLFSNSVGAFFTFGVFAAIFTKLKSIEKTPKKEANK